MDASQITKLRQLQNTTYINRNQTLDSSTLIWKTQLRSSSFIPNTPNTPTSTCCKNIDGTSSYGGSNKTTTLMSGSTQTFPNVYSGAKGSASEIYSSESILLQQASKHMCSESIPNSSYIIVPQCLTTNTNGPTTNTIPINNNSNQYLPPFDTYYPLKNSPIYPKQDQHLTHFVPKCCS